MNRPANRSMNRPALIASLALLAATPLLAHKAPAAPPAAAQPPLATAQVALADGSPAGTAQLRATRQGGLALVLALTGLPPGLHGLHLHSVGKCEGPAFTSAGGHLNPDGHKHGLYSPSGPHLGDLPNLEVQPDGTAKATLPLAGTKDALLAALFDADGTALVLHAKIDDYQTDPSGNSGARIACGVLQKG